MKPFFNESIQLTDLEYLVVQTSDFGRTKNMAEVEVLASRSEASGPTAGGLGRRPRLPLTISLPSPSCSAIMFQAPADTGALAEGHEFEDSCRGPHVAYCHPRLLLNGRCCGIISSICTIKNHTSVACCVMVSWTSPTRRYCVHPY